MATTAGNIIDQAQLVIPEVNDTVALAYLQLIHNELCFDFKLSKATATNTSLVAGTRAYSLASGASRVYQVRYVRSATDGDFKVLMPTSEDELDQRYRNWRGMDDGEPNWVFVDSDQVNLVPSPDSSTSGSYPQLQYEYTSVATLSSGTNLPTGVVSYEAWRCGLLWKMAEGYKPEIIEYWRMRYMEERGKLANQLHLFDAHYQRTITPQPYGGIGKV